MEEFTVEPSYRSDVARQKSVVLPTRDPGELLRATLDSFLPMIAMVDPNGVIVEVNAAWKRFAQENNYDTPDFGVGRNYIEVTRHAAEEGALGAERILRGVESVLKGTSAAFEFEYPCHSPQGYRWFMVNVSKLSDPGRGAVIWHTDITSRKKTEESLRRTDERFRLLVEGTPDYAMFLLEPGNIITYWSAGAERVFGWSAQEAVGQSGELIFTPEDRAREQEEKEIETALRNGVAADRRWHIRKDGSRIWVDGVMRRLDGKNGALRGFAKIARDATDQHRIEEELRYARDQLEQRVLERTADLMATNNELERAMSERAQLERDLLEISERERRRIGQDLHDVVCQELTATALFLKSTSNKIGNADAARSLGEAAEIVNRNVAIARDLARGFQPAMMGAGGLIEALRRLCKEVQRHRDVDCKLKLPKSIRIRDETLALNVFRVAQEAARNAVAHSGGSEVVICIERERDFIRLVVEDNGKGFRPRKRSKGLGLHIMRYRANILGGTLMIDARPKGGTKVTCEIPVPSQKSRPRKK